MKNSFRYNFRLFLNVYSLFKPLQGCELLLGEDGAEFCTCFGMIAFYDIFIILTLQFENGVLCTKLYPKQYLS